MKSQLLKFVYLLFLLPTLLLANNGFNGKYTKEKKINKEYNVNANALLKLNNKYGNLHVTSWNENRVVIEVHIKTNGDNEAKVQKRLDEIDVHFDASRESVYAKTTFANKTNWNWGKKSNKVSMKINYTVKVPVTNSVNLNNDYGGIYLDKIEGVANISCDYGKIEIGSLLADGNSLSFDYTKNSTIEYMKSGKINADYSGFTLERIDGNLTLSADYSASKIGKASNVVYSCDYGSITIDNAKNVKANGDYLSAKLGTIHGNLDISADYGSVKIAEMASNAGNININSDYTGIKIGYNSGYHFTFDVQLEYAGFSGKELEFTQKHVKSSEKKYKGYHGSQNARNTVTIRSEYGGVTMYKN
jgi:hypothetical protein